MAAISKHTVGMVHVVPSNVARFGQVSVELMPGTDVVHFVDGGLPSMAGESLRSRVVERLQIHALLAQESGAEAILLTCTAFGRLAAAVQTSVSCPVMAVLELVVEEAANLEGRVGILGTHPGTVSATSRMLEDNAKSSDRRVQYRTFVCDGAFEAMQRGDGEVHDRLVLQGLRRLAQETSSIIVPQPSVETAARAFAESNTGATVLTSIRLSVLRLRQILDATM